MLLEQTLEVFLRLLRPLTGLYRAERLPKLGKRGNEFALFRRFTGVLSDILAELFECFMLRLLTGPSVFSFLRRTLRPSEVVSHTWK